MGLIRMSGRTNHIYYPYIQTKERVYGNIGSTNTKVGKGYKWKV